MIKDTQTIDYSAFNMETKIAHAIGIYVQIERDVFAKFKNEAEEKKDIKYTDIAIDCDGNQKEFQLDDFLHRLGFLDEEKEITEPKIELSYPDHLTNDLKFVLGLPIQQTGPIAHTYRENGHKIPRRIEEEQAFVLDRLVRMIIEKGEHWREFFAQDIETKIQ